MLLFVILCCMMLPGMHNRAFASDQRHRKGEAMRIKSQYLELYRNIILNTHYLDWDSADGSGWPTIGDSSVSLAVSMSGKRRLDNFANIVAQVIFDKIPGHVIESGCWRGGASFMAAKVIELLGETKERKVYMADSFSGIPKVQKPRFQIEYAAHTISILKDNSVERVRNDSVKFGVANGLRFLVGNFDKTLPALVKEEPTIRFSVLRMDGATYNSTLLTLELFYDRVTPGGYIIVDDFSDWRPCMAAVDEFRLIRNIIDPLILIPHMPGEQNRGVYWRKTQGTLSVPLLSKYSLYPCLGDGRRNHGQSTSIASNGPFSLRVHGSYSPYHCIQMPPNGPPGVNVLNLKGRADLFMCYDG